MTRQKQNEIKQIVNEFLDDMAITIGDLRMWRDDELEYLYLCLIKEITDEMLLYKEV